MSGGRHGAAMTPSQVQSPQTGGLNAPSPLDLRHRGISAKRVREALADPVAFSRATLPGYGLRRYQEGPALALAAAIAGRDRDLAIVFARQSGKDELLAQVLAWFVARYQRRGGSAVVAAPTLRPQAIVTRDRMLNRLELSALGAGYWRDGHKVGMGRAEVGFVSAGKDANTRGLTAASLLVANEAQDIDPERWDAVFSPMTASTAAPALYMGTEFDGTGLLARQIDHLRDLEARDGKRRVWFVPWQPIAAEVPAYRAHYESRVAQFGESYPLIRTEYWLERLEEGMGLFPEERRRRMAGDHPRRREGEPRKKYGLLVDVAGGDEASRRPGAEFDPASKRDSTALTVVEVEPGKTGAGLDALPLYRVADRAVWTGRSQPWLRRELCRLARETWGAAAVAIDATGLGAGLAAELADELGRGRRKIAVYPYVFTQKSKSDLGWAFVGLIDGGRYREYAGDGRRETEEFWRQAARCVYAVREGPGKLLSWGARPGEHDDLLISAALCAVLDQHDWRSRSARGTAPAE